MERIAIIGAGVAGLACAVTLAQRQIPVQILDCENQVGGRIRTDEVDGFLLDRGFQVLLTAYPECRRLLNYSALQLNSFEPGALVRTGGKLEHVADPRREFSAILPSLFARVGTLADKLKVARLAARLLASPVEDLMAAPEVTTMERLRQEGFSDEIIRRFFRPFLVGIFLENELNTSSRKFEFVFKMFAQGDAALPEKGMQQIPEQLASRLPSGSLRIGAKVAAIRGTTAVLESGEEVPGTAIVVATSDLEAQRLVGLEPRKRSWHYTTTYYFAADKAPTDLPILILNGEGTGVVNNVAVLSNVCASYAPKGAALISVSVVEPTSMSGLDDAVRTELVRWFGAPARAWQLLKRYDIANALPSENLLDGGVRELPVRVSPRVYVAGDCYELASSNGAMHSGIRAAEAVMEDLRL